MAEYPKQIKAQGFHVLCAFLLNIPLAFAQEEEAPLEETTGGMALTDYLLIAAAAFIVLFLLYWVISIVRGLALRRRHGYSIYDGQPTVDERLSSELAPMQVALLRGNIQGFYEKSRAVSLQILSSRGLIESSNPRQSSEELIQRLKSIGVDPVFLDCFETIMARCDAVLNQGERPDDSDNRKMIEDMRTLIRMRPKASKQPTEPERDEAPDADA